MPVTQWKSKSLSAIDEFSVEFAEILHDAHNGNAQAQHALGMWYETHGEREKAEQWYRKAADQGYEGAWQAHNELLSN